MTALRPVRVCGCGRRYETVEEFDALPLVGTQNVEGEVVVMRNCACGTTLGRVAVPHPEDVLGRLEAD